MALACGTPSAPCGYSPSAFLPEIGMPKPNLLYCPMSRPLRKSCVGYWSPMVILVKRMARASRKRVNESLTKAPPSWAPN